MSHAAPSGPRYRLDVAEAFHRGLRAGGVDVRGLPPR